ncbi:MAG: PTS fructose transporter subunit IIA [bacterium]|nr:PTS fructose transporter subunit IIA [bacterium]
MIPVLVLTHGGLADELVEAAQKIDPDLADVSSSLCLPWDIDSDEASKQLQKMLKDLNQGQGVVVLTDMFGGTATNLALPLLNPDKVDVVTGVNLPMLVKLSSLRRQDLSVTEVADRLRTAGQKSIRVASEFLKS